MMVRPPRWRLNEEWRHLQPSAELALRDVVDQQLRTQDFKGDSDNDFFLFRDRREALRILSLHLERFLETCATTDAFCTGCMREAGKGFAKLEALKQKHEGVAESIPGNYED